MLFFLAQQCVAPIKCCSGQAHRTGGHPSPTAGLCRAVPSSCSMPSGSCPQDTKGGLLPFCQDTLNQKGKDKWHERSQKGLQGLWNAHFSGAGSWSLFSQLPPQPEMESPRVLLQHSSSSRGLAWAWGEHKSPLFQQENRITELHSPSSVIPLAVLEWAGTGLCAKILLFPPWRWEKWIPNGSPSVDPSHISRHTILIPRKQTSCSWGHISKGQWPCQAFHKPNTAAPDAALPW